MLVASIDDDVDLAGVTSLLGTINVASLTDDQLARLTTGAESLLNATHALSAMALDEFQRRRTWTDDGSLSGARWMANRTGTSTRSLRARVRAGAGLRLLPDAGAVARQGQLSPTHVEVLAACARRHPALAVRDEALLVGQARALDAESFAAAARQWQACADALDSAEPDPTAPEPVDELHLSRTFDGRYQLNGTFSSEAGEVLAAALDGEVDRALRAARDGDPSVSAVVSRVRASALIDLVGQTMRREPSDQSVPDRYRVAVALRHDEDDPPLAACDSAAFRLVLGARSEVLDVGRLTQQWPAGLRRAITHRDGGCVFPGCDRPPSWCDIHHCVPWSEGGTTSLGNGALLCRRHHSFVHARRWTASVEDGTPVIRRSDGSPFKRYRWNETDDLGAVA